MQIDPEYQTEGDRITAQLAAIGFVLPGTVLHRHARCGKPHCRCHAEPPALHGPFWSWTRKVTGKTVTRRLTDAQLRDYQPWFDNSRRLRALVTELEGVSLRALDDDPRWGHK
ncbi:MAG TPA: DUF6788 family protein [Pseudonocardiaceae bacterium]|nr:DUF6788 family protein [Pseudonocardiaceae bacterium]